MALCKFGRAYGEGSIYINPAQVVSVLQVDDYTHIFTTAGDQSGQQTVTVTESVTDVVKRLDNHYPMAAR